jgi:hypothetical protein
LLRIDSIEADCHKEHNVMTAARRLRSGVVIVAGLAVVVLTTGCARPLSEDPDTSEGHIEVASTLEMAVSSLVIPTGWESELVPVEGGGLGQRVSPDLSSSGTWMVVLVLPQTVSEDGESPDDRFWRYIDQVADGPMEFAHEPVPTNADGLTGYRYEVSGATGNRTGQELGGYLAIFFGPGYNYEVIAQFELSDRDKMSNLFDDTLARLTVAPNNESI